MKTFKLKAQVFYTDGTNSAITQPVATTALLEVGEAVTYPAGFERLGLDALNPAKTPEYYQVWLTNNNGVTVANKRTFYIREKEYNEMDLWFQNSLGVVEAVALCSGYTYGVRVEKQEFIKSMPFDITNTVHEIATNDPVFEDRYKATTGWMGKKEIMPYIDLLISKRVYWIRNGQRVPVTIAAGTFEIVTESESRGEYAYAINFEFTNAFSQPAFSDVNA